MSPPLDDWRVTREATNDEAYAILSQDPVWHCFALADLEPPLRDYSQFAIASQHQSNERALCLILRHPIIGQVLSPFGSSGGIEAILKQLALPARPLIQAQETHIPLLQPYYQPETTWKRMVRMAITSTSWRPLQSVHHRPVKHLTISDLPALKNLYTHHPESGFPLISSHKACTLVPMKENGLSPLVEHTLSFLRIGSPSRKHLDSTRSSWTGLRDRHYRSTGRNVVQTAFLSYCPECL